MIRDAGLAVSCLCRGGMFPAADDAARRAALDDNKRAVDEAVAIGAGSLVLIAGGLPKGSKDIAGARAQVRDGLAALLDYSRSADMPLSMEPLHPMYAADRACVNTLAHANDLCDELGEGLGIALDAYHVWWDPDLARQIERAGPADPHLSCLRLDGADPRSSARPWHAGRRHDRSEVDPRAWSRPTGYDGFIDVEIFSAQNWWKRDPDEVLRICLERHRTVV